MSVRNPSVDIGKFLFSIFVVGIHTRPLSDLSELADFVLCDIIFRVAVPFFAICTGYYLTRKMESKRGGSRWIIVKTMAFRVLLLYVLWSFFYLIVLTVSWYKTGILELSSYIGWFKSFLIGSSYYHLWYLAQLFWALFPFYMIVKYVNPKWHTLIACSLWLLGAFDYVYSDVLGIAQGFVRVYNQFGAFTGMLGRMLPLLLIGSILAKRPVKGHDTAFFISLLLLCCLSFEVFFIKHQGASHFSYVLFTLPLACSLFLFIQSIDFNCHINTKSLSKASMNVYLLHPAVLYFLREFGIHSSLLLFILGVLISVSLVYAIKHI